MIYLNANGTTKPDDTAIEETVKWMQIYDTDDKENKLLLNRMNKYINKLCNAEDYNIIYTSGASESNSTIIRSITEAYFNQTGIIPHVIISAIEHKSIISCCETLYMLNKITYTKINPEIDGRINPCDIEYQIQKNTCLICIMYANNEIGSINNVKQIKQIADKYDIAFHCDAVQMFGKTPIDVTNFTSISMSFHKLYYLKGFGMLIINKNFMNTNKLKCIIAGNQQFHFRGGTLPNYLIAGSYIALKQNFYQRDQKNKHLLNLRTYLLDKFKQYIPLEYFVDQKYQKYKLCIVLYGPKNNKHIMPNTCLISVYSPYQKFCNMKFKQRLYDNNIIISIGSNCNADSSEASHVINSLNINPVLKRGTLRISFSDSTTEEELNTFISIFLKCLNEQIEINELVDKKITKLVKKIRFKTHIKDVLTDKAVPEHAYY